MEKTLIIMNKKVKAETFNTIEEYKDYVNSIGAKIDENELKMSFIMKQLGMIDDEGLQRTVIASKTHVEVRSRLKTIEDVIVWSNELGLHLPEDLIRRGFEMVGGDLDKVIHSIILTRQEVDKRQTAELQKTTLN